MDTGQHFTDWIGRDRHSHNKGHNHVSRRPPPGGRLTYFVCLFYVVAPIVIVVIVFVFLYILKVTRYHTTEARTD